MLNLFSCPQVAKKKKNYLTNYILLQVSEGTVVISLLVFPPGNRTTFPLSIIWTENDQKGSKQTHKQISALQHIIIQSCGCQRQRWGLPRSHLDSGGLYSSRSSWRSFTAFRHMFCCCNTVSANNLLPQISRTRQPQTESHLHRDSVDTTFSHPSFHLFRFPDVRLVLRLLQYQSGKGLSNSPFMALILPILDSAFIFFTLNRFAFWFQHVHLGSTSGSALTFLWWNHASRWCNGRHLENF